MLKVTIPEVERFDESTNTFIYTKAQTLQLEHSLVSISKWEAKWCKSFLSKDNKTPEEVLDYIRCMTLTQNVDPDVYESLPNNILEEIMAYIDAPMTATTFSDISKGKTTSERITSELIYYWMVSYDIPFECQKWHLNRLLTLIHICSVKNAPPKKMGKRDIYSQNKALNKANRAKYRSRG